MDTGSYMQNQMDNLIESGIKWHEQESEKLFIDIKNYIDKCKYTWTVDAIIEEYQKYKNNFYISHTCLEIVNKFEDRLKLLNL